MSNTELVAAPAKKTKPMTGLIPTPIPTGAGAIAAITGNAETMERMGALYLAKAFPRDHAEVTREVNQACSRMSLAQKATYAFPRGGQTVSGPSIRLMEVLVSAWGNVKYGWREISRRFDPEANNGMGCKVSECVAFCEDNEKNLRHDVTFIVPLIRDKRDGGVELTAERDIYELCANMASRRMRSCIQKIVPSWLVEEAMDKIRETLEKGDERPLADILRSMEAKFKDLGVTREMLEANLGHSIKETTRPEIVRLGETYNAIEGGHVRVKDVFGSQNEDDADAPLGVAPAAAASAPKAEKQPATPATAPANDFAGSFDEMEAKLKGNGKTWRDLAKHLTDKKLMVPKGTSHEEFDKFAAWLMGQDDIMDELRADGWLPQEEDLFSKPVTKSVK